GVRRELLRRRAPRRLPEPGGRDGRRRRCSARAPPRRGRRPARRRAGGGPPAGAAEEVSPPLVAVPLGVLKRGARRFPPPLPADHRAAIGRLGFGRFEKVALRFSEPFWRGGGFPPLVGFSA